MLSSMPLWSAVNIIISNLFVLINGFLMIRWKIADNQMRLVASIAVFLQFCTSIYVYFYTTLDWGFFWLCQVIFFVILVFLLAKYRDARTLFMIITVVVFNIVTSIIVIVLANGIEEFWVKTTISVITNIILSYVIFKTMRQSFFDMMELIDRHWIKICLIPVLPLVALLLITNYPVRLSANVVLMPIALAVGLTVLVMYMVVINLIKTIFSQQMQSYRDASMQEQIAAIQWQLQESVIAEKKHSILRHDLRHYANIIKSCIQNSDYDDALNSLEAMLSQVENLALSGSSASRYCAIPVINAVLVHLKQRAIDNDIEMHLTVCVEEDLTVDNIELAVLLSNSIENAINACITLPEEREKVIKLKMVEFGKQLHINISNTAQDVKIDNKTLLPITDKEGHGVGTVSMMSFVQKYSAYVSSDLQDGWFNLRFII